ncbi:hypothetical protein [Mycolicibacterium mengxianglii]|uniref:hypothetical protein n=1 Tax=Mycolicibacterium mengxianglii TaxID=2736649 RepID=UPI0018EEFBEF|nr:hypothetical protein [Mycolicibacterium mengxianglii]
MTIDKPIKDRDMSLEEIEEASRAARDILRRRIDEMEQAKETQPARLAEVRKQAERARTLCLSDENETWDAMWTAVPTVGLDGEMNGMFAMPSIDGKELWGARLAFDLLGCCADDDDVDNMMSEYFSQVREPEHMFLICAAALTTIASHVAPMLLEVIEKQARDYDTRVRLADAARNAWATRINEAREMFNQAEKESDD